MTMASEIGKTRPDNDKQDAQSNDSPVKLQKKSQEKLRMVDDCDDIDRSKEQGEAEEKELREPRGVETKSGATVVSENQLSDDMSEQSTNDCQVFSKSKLEKGKALREPRGKAGTTEHQLSVNMSERSMNDSQVFSKSKIEKGKNEKSNILQTGVRKISDEGSTRSTTRNMSSRDRASIAGAYQKMKTKYNEIEKRFTWLQQQYVPLKESHRSLDQRNRLLEEEVITLKEQNRLLKDTNLELQQKWTRASNDLAKATLQAGAYKVDDDNIKRTWEHLVWHCRMWCKAFFGGKAIPNLRKDEQAKLFEEFTPNHGIYLASSTLRPVLIQSYLIRQLWLDVLQTGEEGGLLWAGQYGGHLRSLQHVLRPSK